MRVFASEIAAFLNRPLYGEDLYVDGFAPITDVKSNKLLFAKKYSESYVAALNEAECNLAIVGFEYRDKIGCSYICSDNPRLDYIRSISHFFTENGLTEGIHPTAVVEEGAVIGRNVHIGANCFISRFTSIGDNTVILPNVVIDNSVKIGSGCIIKSGSVIGQSGFGYEYDEQGVPVRFPHTGSVLIGDNVHIGANVTIDRAALEQTIIEDNVKIDNHVHIAHNCIIHKNALIIAGAILCGGVEVGENCWVSPNSTIAQRAKTGHHSTVGIGSVVLKKVKDEDVVFGIPAVSINK